MADIAIFRINYKSDFILTLNSDAGWMTPFCIKFWTGAPSQAYYAYYDGMNYTHCAPVEGEPTKLLVQFDDHHLPIGDMKFQIGYHFTVADFPTSVEDEVINQASVIIEVDDAPAQVMLDFNGETAPEIQFALPAYVNEAQRIANEQARIAAEEQRIANEQARISAEETRQANEQQRINAEAERVSDFASLKTESEAATDAANAAATLANAKAQLAADKAALAQAAATLANAKAQLAADKAALAQAAATLANEKAALAQQKAEYAQEQGDAAKTEAEAAHALNEEVRDDEEARDQAEQIRQQQETARQQAESQRVTNFNNQMQQQQTAYTDAEAARDTAFDEAEQQRDAKVDEKVADITNLQAQIGYYVCDTDAAIAAKTIAATNYVLGVGGNIRIKMTNTNTADAVTLNINSTGAKALFYNGEQASSTNSWDAGEVVEMYYDGTQYQCASGGEGSAENIKYDNTQSLLAADNVQEALDEVAESLNDVKDYVMPSEGVDETYDQTVLVNSDQILQANGATRSFSGFKTSDFIAIPRGTKFLYTNNLYKNDSNTYIGLKFYTSNSDSAAISDNVAASGQDISTTIGMDEWPTAKYLKFCSNKSTASIRFYTAGEESRLADELISQEKGQSTVSTMSQKAITDELDNISNDIAEITADGVDFTFDSSNSSVASDTILRISGNTRSMSGYSTSALLDIPARTKYLDTYGLYKNDANTYIGLVLFDESGTKLANVCASGEAIPSTIDLATNYPTAAKLRWCTKGNTNAYVRCYFVSAIKTAMLGMVDDQTGQNDEALMSQKGITDAIANMAEELKMSEYTALQTDALTSPNNNWTFGSAWSYSANGATPPDVGAANYMRNTLIYYSDRRYMRIRVLMGADTKLILTCSYGSSLNTGEGASAFGIDFVSKKIIIYGNTGYGGVTGDTQATSEGYDLTKTVESADIPDVMIGAREYVVELRKYGSISQLTLMDTKTGFSVAVAHDGWACGRQNQLYGFYCESGTLPTLSNFGVYSAKNPDIVFTGDSITEGVYVSNRAYTYANRFRSQYPSKNVVISARGGQTITGLMNLFTSEWNIVRPKKISLLIGANGGNTSATLAAFKDACEAIGTELIMHYCSCRTGRDMSETNNTLIPALAVEGARFDKATAIDNTPNATYSNINTALFGDSVHPNINGHGEMFKRLDIDCPSLKL